MFSSRGESIHPPTKKESQGKVTLQLRKFILVLHIRFHWSPHDRQLQSCVSCLGAISRRLRQTCQLRVHLCSTLTVQMCSRNTNAQCLESWREAVTTRGFVNITLPNNKLQNRSNTLFTLSGRCAQFFIYNPYENCDTTSFFGECGAISLDVRPF